MLSKFFCMSHFRRRGCTFNDTPCRCIAADLHVCLSSRFFVTITLKIILKKLVLRAWDSELRLLVCSVMFTRCPRAPDSNTNRLYRCIAWNNGNKPKNSNLTLSGRLWYFFLQKIKIKKLKFWHFHLFSLLYHLFFDFSYPEEAIFRGP